MRRTGHHPASLRLTAAVLVVAALAATGAHADDVRPVHLDIAEKTPGTFLVQWRVPKVMPPNAMPGPVLPSHCSASGRLTVDELTAAWINRQSYRCAEGLAGERVGIEFPVLNAALSTLVRVELLSGGRYSHMLLPGEDSWQVPDIEAGGFPRLARGASDAVGAGAAHFLHPAHIALLLAMCLFAATQALRLASAFTVGQVGAVAVAWLLGTQISAGLAEIGVAVAAGILARQALLASEQRRQLPALAAAAGIVHGLGLTSILPLPSNLSFSIAGWSLMTVLGMDAAMILSTMALAAVPGILTRSSPRAGMHTVAAYGIAISAFAIATVPPVVERFDVTSESGGLRLAGLPVPAAGAALGSAGRVAARFPDAAIQTFVAIDAFEVRHETLVRVADLAAALGLGSAEEVAVDEQPALKQRIAEHVARQGLLRIDGKPAGTATQRVDFMGIDTQGALPRPTPVPEPVSEALVGVTTIYLLPTTPEQVTLEWTDFTLTSEIPATVTDPEASVSSVLTPAAPSVRWDNELVEDPIPVVTAIAVKPATLWVPIPSLVALVMALAFATAAVRRPRPELSVARVRVMLAVALALGPLANVAVAMPAALGTTPDANAAKRILSGVLPNIYKAFEFRDEEAAFDRLALSVTGDTLTDIYLEHQRALEIEERGGARARVEAFEVTEIRQIGAEGNGGFVAEASWTVGGTVVHYGHRHFRQNRYDARVVAVPVDGSWKIRSITLLDEERVR